MENATIVRTDEYDVLQKNRKIYVGNVITITLIRRDRHFGKQTQTKNFSGTHISETSALILQSGSPKIHGYCCQ